MVVKNYYEILEVSVDSTTAEIKAAYRKLARKYHPDINKSTDAIEIFKEITTAYETLSNPEKREKYNIIKGIFKTEKTTTSSQKAQEEYQNTVKNNRKGFQEEVFAKQKTAQKTSDKIQKHKKFSLIKWFKLLFAKSKKNKRAKENKKPQKGQNITTDVTITPVEVITGSKRVINVLTTQTCPNCSGHKFINAGKCSECNGTGEISTKKRITVTIPKGIKDGAKLRLKGEGGAGKNGGSNGDLYINIKIETPTKIHFDKLNIYYNVPITPYEAALGEEIKIPTFDGTIKLKLPKNTCSGQKFRIAGQGIKKHGKIGDLIITVSIEFSQDLSDDELKLYEKLKNLSHDDLRKNLINEG
ncbi:DnaJ domain-containing protein [bacterium]|nr:DnaJ domain-containing protein [bacterium]